ncbi:MAG: pitrilysin family protein, partial [Gemmatimonadota bacterium]
DVALWMESDRMGHLLGAIDQGKLDEQRGVVQNEKRQGENQPYGRGFELIQKSVYPEGHPYAHSVIGSMADLDAASLDDVRNWFKTYYGPNNAVLVVAGDITPEQAKAKVEEYFGSIPPTPPIEKQEAWPAPMHGEHRAVLQDRVPQARVYKVWNVPAWGSRDLAYLELASAVLSSGKSSRLYKRLVYHDQIATDARAGVNDKEIGGNFILVASAKPGVELSRVEAALDEEMARFLADGPTADELARVKASAHASFLRGLERIGGFGGKSDVLAESQVYGGSPDAYRQYRQWMMSATPADVRDAARKWLSDGIFALDVVPYGKLAAAGTDVDRSKVPDAGPAPEPAFPALERATLSNGLKVVLAERHTLPIVSFSLQVDAGYAADQFARPGTADLALNMMDEGTESMSALQISDAQARLGARLSTGSDLDASYVDLSALKENLAPSLDLFADVILRPSFPDSDFQRLKQQQLVGIQREQASPFAMALRVFPVLLYGKDHPYGIPFTGSGYASDVQAMTRDDLVKFHDTWFRPNNATLIVVGDIGMDELRPMLEARFKGWQQRDVPEKHIGPPPARNVGVVYLMDRPGAQQSVIIVGEAFPPPSNADEFALQAVNYVLGGAFTSRVNMNLREDKHWSYGARTIVPSARGPRPFFAYAPIQTDKTAAAMQELMNEFTGIASQKPPTADELAKVKDGQVKTLPGRWETIRAIESSISEMVSLGLPDDYWQTYASHVRDLALPAVQQEAKRLIHSDRLIWVVVGDRSKIEDSVRQLGFGAIKVLNPEGEVVAQ